MTVKELIAALEEFPEDMDVHFAYNYGDYWRTQVAEHIDRVEEDTVVWSKYHNMPRIASDEMDEEEEASAKTVVVLR